LGPHPDSVVVVTDRSDLPESPGNRFRSDPTSEVSELDGLRFAADAPHVFEKVIRLPDGREHLVVFVSDDADGKVWRRLDQPPVHGWV
jgi:hypothetical protein